jgi:YidC/Oxa1 family membrane protein insertase
MIELLRSLFDPLFDLLGATLLAFHAWGAPWWLSIVMLTIVVRTLLFPLTVRQVGNLRRMQELKPGMDGIRERYKEDPQEQRREMAKLYGESGVNPLGGCLPVLVQIPIFVVLYYTIKGFEHLESMRTGGLFWFEDLTVRDPYFLLPIFYVFTMMAAQEVTIRKTNPQQAQLMRLLPVAFGLFLFHFPAGLFVYWVTSNLITLAQNYAIYTLLPHHGPSPEQNEHTAADQGAMDQTLAPATPTQPAKRRRKKRVGKKG